MGLRNAFKWTVLNRAIAAGALAGGLALVVVGLFAGFGGAVTTLVANPLDPGPAIDQANPTITLFFAVLGLVVWQLGKTYALFVTLPRAAGRAAGRQLDANRLASEVHDGLGDRLAEMEAEIEATRRAVQALEDETSATTGATGTTPSARSSTSTDGGTWTPSSPSDTTSEDGAETDDTDSPSA